MKIVIVGGGKVGELLSVDFSQAGHDVLLIDTSSRVLEQVMDHADISGLVGNGTSYDVMMEAGVAQADFFISVTRIDEVNMIAAIMAKKLGAKYTIARVRTPENYRSFSFFEENLGITMMINPELEAAKKLRRNWSFLCGKCRQLCQQSRQRRQHAGGRGQQTGRHESHRFSKTIPLAPCMHY